MLGKKRTPNSQPLDQDFEDIKANSLDRKERKVRVRATGERAKERMRNIITRFQEEQAMILRLSEEDAVETAAVIWNVLAHAPEDDAWVQDLREKLLWEWEEENLSEWVLNQDTVLILPIHLVGRYPFAIVAEKSTEIPLAKIMKLWSAQRREIKSHLVWIDIRIRNGDSERVIILHQVLWDDNESTLYHYLSQWN